jgi:Cyclin, N-terminal domain
MMTTPRSSCQHMNAYWCRLVFFQGKGGNNISLSNLTAFFLLVLFFRVWQDGEITIGTRDGAAHVLRCLKVWYDLPKDVLFTATNLVDRFLTKMKVRPKHMACISVGSFVLAIKQLGVLPIDTEDLVAISQVS